MSVESYAKGCAILKKTHSGGMILDLKLMHLIGTLCGIEFLSNPFWQSIKN